MKALAVLRPSRFGVGGEWAVDRRLAGRALIECPTVMEVPMYGQSKLSELIRFARVDAGAAVIDVYPGDGDWTRLFSDVVGPQGQVYSFVPSRSRSLQETIRSAACGQLCEGAGPGERRSRLVADLRGDAGGHKPADVRSHAPVLPRSPPR